MQVLALNQELEKAKAVGRARYWSARVAATPNPKPTPLPTLCVQEKQEIHQMQLKEAKPLSRSRCARPGRLPGLARCERPSDSGSAAEGRGSEQMASLGSSLGVRSTKLVEDQHVHRCFSCVSQLWHLSALLGLQPSCATHGKGLACCA